MGFCPHACLGAIPRAAKALCLSQSHDLILETENREGETHQPATGGQRARSEICQRQAAPAGTQITGIADQKITMEKRTNCHVVTKELMSSVCVWDPKYSLWGRAQGYAPKT